MLHNLQWGEDGGDRLGSLSTLWSTCNLSVLLWKNSGAVVAKKISFWKQYVYIYFLFDIYIYINFHILYSQYWSLWNLETLNFSYNTNRNTHEYVCFWCILTFRCILIVHYCQFKKSLRHLFARRMNVTWLFKLGKINLVSY